MSFEKMIASLMYIDRMSVSRSQLIVDHEKGTSSYVFQPVEDLLNIPCHVSFSKADHSNTESVDVIDGVTTIKIFCDSAIVLQKGDQITAFKKVGERLIAYQGYVGKPVFGLTQEIVLLAEAPA